jgi:hypothetical protein
MINKSMYYIYAYIDPRNNQPFYIGKGTKNIKFNHLKEHNGNTDNRDKLKILKELQVLSLSPIITELESDIKNELIAYNREDYYILFYGRKGIESYGILSNKIIGGKTPPKPIWTEEKKKKHSDFNKSYWTEEKRKHHGSLTKGNKGGASTKGTISVTDIHGNNMRIPKSEYDNMDKTGNINDWKYVSVSSNESKRRNTNKETHLGTVVANG